MLHLWSRWLGIEDSIEGLAARDKLRWTSRFKTRNGRWPSFKLNAKQHQHPRQPQQLRQESRTLGLTPCYTCCDSVRVSRRGERRDSCCLSGSQVVETEKKGMVVDGEILIVDFETRAEEQEEQEEQWSLLPQQQQQ